MFCSPLPHKNPKYSTFSRRFHQRPGTQGASMLHPPTLCVKNISQNTFGGGLSVWRGSERNNGWPTMLGIRLGLVTVFRRGWSADDADARGGRQDEIRTVELHSQARAWNSTVMGVPKACQKTFIPVHFNRIYMA